MTATILKILLTGGQVFSDERRRYFSKKLLELNEDLDKEEAKAFPDYNDGKLARAQKALDNFTEAYAKEFEKGLAELLAKVASNE